jgi:hypothetical protein
MRERRCDKPLPCPPPLICGTANSSADRYHCKDHNDEAREDMEELAPSEGFITEHSSGYTNQRSRDGDYGNHGNANPHSS